jgi:hypothetical protein
MELLEIVSMKLLHPADDRLRIGRETAVVALRLSLSCNESTNRDFHAFAATLNERGCDGSFRQAKV